MILALLLASGPAAAAPGLHPPPHLPSRWAYDAVWGGGGGEAETAGPANDVGLIWDEPVELTLSIRNVSDGPTFRGIGVTHNLRMSRDPSGRTMIDELTIQARFVGLGIRPAMGDNLDLSLIGGRWDQNVYGLARAWTHLQVFVPVHLVAVGFSDTDADVDSAIRYYAAAGAGIGADWMVRIAGPVGLRLRAEGAGDTMHRLRVDDRDQVRHEVWGRVEGDLVLIDDAMPFTFGVWAEQRTQWEPRDTPDGIDRQVVAGGIRFGLRLFRGSSVFGGPVPDVWTDGSPANVEAIEAAERRHGRTNGRNGRRLEDDDETPLAPEEVPPPATPEEADANNSANGP